MLRIVKMCFREEELESFLELFDQVKPKIESFPGCSKVDLVQDRKDSSTLMTISIWEDETSLEAYRHSDLFEKTWKKTKAKFSDRPEAWSVDRIK